MGTITWTLQDDELGIMERLGLAGLYMTLRHTESGALGDLSWELGAQNVTLTWPEACTDRDALLPLVQHAWQTLPTSESEKSEGLGVFYFPALHEQQQRGEFARRLHEHRGILSTFLQHPRVQPKTSPLSTSISRDEAQITLRWVEPKGSVKYVSTAESDLFEGPKGKKKSGVAPFGFKAGLISLSSFLVPGATARHGGEGSWEGSAPQAFLLLFTPIASYHVSVGIGAEWLIVCPDVVDLEAYRRTRRRAQLATPDEADEAALDHYAINLADGALGVMLRLLSSDLDRQLIRRTGQARCLVVRLGEVAWNRQTVRHQSARVVATPSQLAAYESVRRHLRTTMGISTKNQTEYPRIPLARDPIAANILNCQYWYRDLFHIPRQHREFITKQAKQSQEPAEKVWLRHIFYSREALRQIMSELTPEDSVDRHFEAAFHTALSRRYKAEAVRAGSQGAEHGEGNRRGAGERMEHMRETLRRGLMHANTRTLLRHTLAAFFAEAGHNPTLQEHGREVWSFIDGESSWTRARDLALLSIVTYQRRESDPPEAHEDDPGEPPTDES